MSSLGVDMSTMWRLSEDLSAARRFGVHRGHHHHPHHHHHPFSHHRTASIPVIYNG